ncbi:WXG100 family type VII secretion target [Gordonia terrae]|uniref:WXG100 family type VII secretion target n=1 Tax=Gordonia terrae TaxID=2055 RepID=UPI003F6A5D0C
MRPSIAQLRQWHPHSFTDAGTVAGDTASAIDTAVDAAVRTVDAARSWHGATHDAVRQRISQEQDHAGEVRSALQMIADEASDAGADLTHARDVVLRIVDAARWSGFTVGDDGSVSHPDGGRSGQAADFANEIADALAVVDTLDDRYGARLEGFATDLSSMITGRPDVTVPGGVTMDADDAVHMLETLAPAQVRAVVEQMDPVDVRRLIRTDPHVMGNLPGVPFHHRIQANEINIRNALADEIQAGRGGGRRATTLRDLLTPAPSPGASGDRRGVDALAERQFITFVNTPRGRMVEMIGSLRPGTRNTATYVPGTGTDLDTAGGHNRTAAAELAALTAGPVFLYLDGDLPPDLIAAADPVFAAAMAPRLELFGAELDAEIQRHSPGATTTFVGHSYGGSIVGTAEQLGLTPDRVIHASSAGTGIYDAPHPSGVDRYSLTFPGDPIHYSQSLPGNPHGRDPDTEPGVIRLDTGTVTIDGREHHGGLKTHGAYWNDPDSTAFRNMVKVITGAEPDLYRPRWPDVPELPPPPPGSPAPLWWLYPFNDRADGDIDLPGSIPDIPLRLPW